ncbi:DUF4492 domain-containing protein [Desulfobulbus oligotrophicus]|uniref:DUF4492 domain-containing protein n=1 Tax=Desulfobulbus oligotrophicus TaxID=1909699 RepID=A0A7T6ARW6_9BACT|nr:DUF4492 domain-containing protein [Desulfobulbus oligotrophicus]QQG66948.1 DUF4492 domain-containing protein [Desulfobulbus oligotrophicus]
MTQSSPPRFRFLYRIYRFYRDGFSEMTVGYTLWKIIFLKLFILFAVFKVFFFPDFLAVNFATDAQRADHVLEQLTREVLGSTNLGKGEAP